MKILRFIRFINKTKKTYFTFNYRQLINHEKSELPTLTEAKKKELKVINILQCAKVNISNNKALQPGEYIQLKYWDGAELVDKFPINTSIGWILHSNGFNESDFTVAGNSINTPWFYSVPEWNPESDANKKNHTITFTATAKDGKEYVCFGFEDMLRQTINGQGAIYDEDCNDLVFHVLTNPSSAIVPPHPIPVEGELKTKESVHGILAFEDNWPMKGDYDLNDVVVKYQSTINFVQKTKDGVADGAQYVSKLEDKFTLIHTGADYHNSFKIKVENIATNKIKSMTLNEVDYTPIANGNGFVIEVCPLVSKEAGANGAITPYKKLSEEEYAEYDIVIEFNEGEVIADDFNKASNKMSKAPYNPYISPSPHVQVHLPNYPPVFDEDMNNNGLDLFGRHSDRSKTRNEDTGEWEWTGKYYVSGDNNSHPYAIHLSNISNFTIPAEIRSIEYTYPGYASWVNNGCGTTDADWYTRPNSTAELNYSKSGK